MGEINTKAKRQFENFYTAIKREGATELLDWLRENGFFEAPASTKYHGAYKGGLAVHSNNVYFRLRQLAYNAKAKMVDNNNGQIPEYSEETLAIVALLHDVCKIDAHKVEKKNQKQPDGKWAEVETFGYTNNMPLGHGEKSVILILQHMKLTEEEMVAIRWHMGGFDYATKGGCYEMNNAFDTYKLAAMLHIADMAATYLDE